MKNIFVAAAQHKRAAVIAAIVFIVLMVIPVTLVGVYYWFDSNFTNQVYTQQQTLSDIAALALKVRLDRLVDIASSMASSTQLASDVTNGQWVGAAGVARDLQNNVNYYDPFIDRVIIYDASGTQKDAYPALTGGLGTSASNSAWYKALMGGGATSYVSGVARRVSLPQIQVINISVPISSPRGIVGFLVLQIPTDNFLEFGGNVSLGTYGFVYIVDSSGNIVAHPRLFSENGGVVNYSFVSEVQKALAGGSGTDIVTDKTSGEKSLVTYKPVDSYGWGIVIQELYSEAFSTVSAILLGIELLIVAVTLIDIIIAFILFRFFMTHDHV